VEVRSCGLCHGEEYRRDNFKGATIRLVAEVKLAAVKAVLPRMDLAIASALIVGAITICEIGARASTADAAATLWLLSFWQA